MLDLLPYVRRPISTLTAVASDPIESWMRFREQYAAHREGCTPPDLYKVEKGWEARLHDLIGLPSPGEVTQEFWALWPKVIEELEAKGIRAGPESFKGWNDGDAGFVRAIWCLVSQSTAYKGHRDRRCPWRHSTFHSRGAREKWRRPSLEYRSAANRA